MHWVLRRPSVRAGLQLDVQSCTADAVYTGLSAGARGILFPDNADECLPIEDGKDSEGCDTALRQQGGQRSFLECMDDAMTNRFTKASEVLKKRLSLGAKFILIGLAEMASINRREIGPRVERREDQGPVRMQHPVPFAEGSERRRHIRKREIAHQASHGTGLERKGIHPIGLNPGRGERRHRGQPPGETGGQLPL